MKHLSLRIALFCLALPLAAICQNAKTANKLYDQMGYKLAIPEYEKMEELSLEELARVANSYRLNGDSEHAMIWYSQVVQLSEEPEYFLYYAQALQSNGYLKEAKDNYLMYHQLMGGETNDQRGMLLANAIDRISEFEHKGVEVKNEDILNSSRLDFSPAYTKNGIVFVSSRGNGNKHSIFKDKWIDDNFMDLFFAEKKENGELGEPTPFSHELLTKFHEGPVVFSKNDNRIYFTRNQFNKGKRKNSSDGVMKQNIYVSHKEGNDWTEVVELPFNTDEFEEVHPAISPDGHTMFFASDRAGGFGQMDLYMVTRRGVEWGTPVNLGPEVNTPGNELFPFVHDDGTLYFASNGWGGLGGLDIFSTYMVNDSVWLEAHNIGAPFNSPKDDFGLIMNTSNTEGYFTSSRDDGQGMDDIYSFKIGRPIALKTKVLSKICVYHEKTDERLKGAKVKVSEIRDNGEEVVLNDDLIMRLVETENQNEYILKLKQDINEYGERVTPTYRTDENGEISVELKPERKYRFTAEKEGFVLAERTVETGDSELFDFCIPMGVSNCLVLNGQTRNGKFTDKMVAGASVTMISLCTGEEVVVRSNKYGEFQYPCLECGCEYILKGEKTNFKSGVADVSTVDEDCSNGGVIGTEILLTPADRDELVFAGQKISVGESVELKNIFYDFDKYYIRTDARPDLNNVVNLMKEYPNLIIELGSHTDARGSKEYNENLSQNRANAAVEYIVQRGIDNRRIVARGYGESQPRNQCHDGAECTEADHQYNRRTEIKILSNNGDDLKVKYIDNLPTYIDEAGY